MEQVALSELARQIDINGLIRKDAESTPIQRFNYARINRVDYRALLHEALAVGRHRVPGFVIDGNNRFAYINIAKWVVGDNTVQALDPRTRNIVKGDLRKGIYLAGGTGTGKTIAMEILSFLANEHNLMFKARNATRFLCWANQRADVLVQRFAQEGGIWPYDTETSCLCVQDFGTEPPSATYMGTKCDVIRQLVEMRYDNRAMITHFTSNIPLWQKDILVSRYGDRAFDRIQGGCNYFEMGGASRR